MMLFPKEKLVVLSVPKTGTTALMKALAPRAGMVFWGPPRAKHVGLEQVQRRIFPILGPEARGIESMALIREPIDWLGSWFRYRLSNRFVGRPQSTRRISFADFIEAYLQEGERPAYANIGGQNWFMKNPAGEVAIDHLFRYEAMEAYSGFLAERLGVEFETKPANVSPQGNLTLPEELRARLTEHLAEDIRLWEGARH